MSVLNTKLTLWLDRAVPEAISSSTAQGLNAIAGVIGVVFVLNNNIPTTTVTNIAYAVTIQSVTAVVIAISCRIGTRSGFIRAIGISVAGTGRGLLVWLILDQNFNDFPTSDGIAQVVGSLIFTSLWLLTAGHIVQGTRDYRATFGARFEQAVTTGLLDSRNSTSWNEAITLADAEHVNARAKIDGVASNLDANLDAEIARNMIAVAAEIHEAALERIRPMSHRLWAQGSSHNPPSLRIRVVLNRALSIWQTPVMVAAGSAALVTGFGAMVSRDLPVGLFTAGIVAIVAAILLRIRQWIQNQSQPHVIASAISLLAIAPATFVVLEIAGRAIGLPADIPGTVVVSSASLALCFTVTALVGIRQHRSALLAEMDHLLRMGFWQTEINRAVESRHAYEAATFLHHKVQSQLLAVALQLELAAQSNNHTQLVETINKARSILGGSSGKVVQNQDSYDSLTHIPKEWDGICSVNIQTPKKDDLPRNTWSLVDVMVRELVANAVRAGQARRVEVKVLKYSPLGIEVRVDDNGIGQLHAKPGLGTTWLHAVSGNVRVSESTLGGASVSLNLPVIE